MRLLTTIALLALAALVVVSVGQTNQVGGLTAMFVSQDDASQYVRLTWPAQSGQVYQVQYCTNPALTNWQPYTNLTALSNGTAYCECYMIFATNPVWLRVLQ